MLSLEKKFEKLPLQKEKYIQTTNEYIRNGHTSTLPKAEVIKQSTKIINYRPCHAMTHMNKVKFALFFMPVQDIKIHLLTKTNKKDQTF